MLLYIIAFWVSFTGVAEGRRGHRAGVLGRGRVGPVPRGGSLRDPRGGDGGPAGRGLFSLVWLIGIYAILLGIVLIAVAFRVRGMWG